MSVAQLVGWGGNGLRGTLLTKNNQENCNQSGKKSTADVRPSLQSKREVAARGNNYHVELRVRRLMHQTQSTITSVRADQAR